MREVIDLFREVNTLDELGIGSVRDTFANALFPGLSTIQTRARYFFFVPWVYRQLEKEKVRSSEASRRARRLQSDLANALKRGSADDETGIIGGDAGEAIQRPASSVYWGGLGTFGFRKFQGSAEDYHRNLDSHYRRLANHKRGEGDELHEQPPINWHPGMPEAPSELFVEANFELTHEEVEFLRDRMVFSRPDSLLAHLVTREGDFQDAPTPWSHVAATDLPPKPALWLDHARRFSLVMHGAALAYNLMLAELAHERNMGDKYEELRGGYQDRLASWASDVDATPDIEPRWDIDEFWALLHEANPRIPHPTRLFVNRWIGATRDDLAGVVRLSGDTRNLIKDREVALKAGQARLTNHRALEMWNGAAGTAPLTYRWRTAERMLADINGNNDDA